VLELSYTENFSFFISISGFELFKSILLSQNSQLIFNLITVELLKSLITETTGIHGTIENHSTLIAVVKASILFHEFNQTASDILTLVTLVSLIVFQVLSYQILFAFIHSLKLTSFCGTIKFSKFSKVNETLFEVNILISDEVILFINNHSKYRLA
jgi:hypothetical protein